MKWMLGVLLSVVVAPSGMAQEALVIPEDLQDFWAPYSEAQAVDDEDAMDRVVRLKPVMAEESLDLFLDDLSRTDSMDVHEVVRTLAWSMDRVAGSEQFIERVRFVIDSDLGIRRRRQQAIRKKNEGQALFADARISKGEDDYEATRVVFMDAFEEFDDIGDLEYSIFALADASEVERWRGRPWERSRILKRIVSLGSELRFRLANVENAKVELASLLQKGVDPDGPKPAPEDLPDDLGPPVLEGGETGGFGLSAWVAGSQSVVIPLAYEAPKKGIGGVPLPTFSPADNYYLWPFTWIGGEGPSDMDSQRRNVFQPKGELWSLRREGATYFIDPGWAGSEEIEFTPNTSPVRVDVPGPEGDTTAVVMAVPGDREGYFSVEVNYQPNPAGARLRFNIAGHLTGKALGQVWKVFDTNLNGIYGDVTEAWDDLVTKYSEESHVSYWEPDSVLIGRAKVAIPWSSVIPVGDQFFRATIDAETEELTVRELNLATGTVKASVGTKLKATHLILKEVGRLEGAYFDVSGKKGTVVPAGRYKFVFGRLEGGKRTSMDQVRMYTGASEEFDVAAGETVTLKMGPPYSLIFETRLEGQELFVDTRTLRIFGNMGEEYACLFDEALLPVMDVRDASGKLLMKQERMRQVDSEAWMKNTGADNILWFPREVRVPNPKRESLEVRLSQKSHRLLGGPLSSEWISPN